MENINYVSCTSLNEKGSTNNSGKLGFENEVCSSSKVSLSTLSECTSTKGSKSCLLAPQKKKPNHKKEFYQLVYLNKLNEGYGTIDYGNVSSITCEKVEDIFGKDAKTSSLSASNNKRVKNRNKKYQNVCLNTYGNIIALSVSLMFLYSAFISLKSLQSTIHYGFGGIGIVSLSCIYGSGVVSCLIGPKVIQIFGHKFVLASSIFVFLVYIVCNLLPEKHLYFIIPASIILGCSKGFLWITASAFITILAIHYSSKINCDRRVALCKFNGIFYSIYSTAQIWAHFISSVVLTLSNSTVTYNANDYIIGKGYTINKEQVNDSDVILTLSSLKHEEEIHLKGELQNLKCGGQYVLSETLPPVITSHINSAVTDNSSTDKFIAPLRPISYKTWLVLCSVYVFLVLLSVIIIFTFLKDIRTGQITETENEETKVNSLEDKGEIKLKEEGGNPINSDHVKKNTLLPILQHQGVLKTLSLFKDPRIQLLVPLILFTAFKESFVFTDYTKYYVSCAIGIHAIGMTMICYGLLCTLGSLFIGLVVKHIKGYIIITAGTLFEAGNMMVLLWWTPHIGDSEVFYVIASSMGLCDAIWKTQINVLLGVLFQENPEEAFSIHRMVFYAGLSLAFGCSQFLLIKTKIYIMGAFLVFGLGLYAVVHVKCTPKAKSSNNRVALKLVPMM